MNAIATKEEPTLFDATLKAAIIYDDFDFAVRATAMLERVALHVDEAMRWDVKPWRLDVLKQPELAAITVAVAADADLIGLALNRTHLMPEELMNWLENWAARRQIEDAAVLALSADANAVTTPLWHELERFAKWRGLTFIGNHNAWNGDGSLHFIRRLWQREQLVSAAFQTYAESPPAPLHWGINE